jgi:two-component system, chemotaxis family, sensor kinase CheA
MARDPARYLRMFIDASRDNLTQLAEAVGKLSRLPAEGDSVHAAFRAAHTIKGSARMLNLVTISETAHAVEDLLGALRDGQIDFAPAVGDVLQRSIDALGGLVDLVAEGGRLPPVDESLTAALVHAAQGGPSPPIAAPPPAIPALPAASAPAPSDAPTEARIKTPDTVRVGLSKLDDLIKLMGEVSSSHARLRQRLTELEAEERSVRGGGVTASASLAKFATTFRNELVAQGLLMGQLNDAALTMRMLPLSWVFEPTARLARDLGRSLGKAVECTVSGAEIELDRQIIERLGDPLLHLLRNAIDHGIETPDQRRAAGKPATGQVRLHSYQDGATVVIEVGDDGGGLPLDRIRAKAVQKGYLEGAQADVLTDAQAGELIFLPGFSTSPILTDISGRGVGMDAVRKTIVDDLLGAIAIDTIPGAGTSFRLRLPLSLAVMRVLLCRVGQFTVGFTAQYVHQIVRLPATDTIAVAGRPAFVLHNEFVPLVTLADLLRFGEIEEDRKADGRGNLVVVVGDGSGKLGLVVDELVEEQDMVLKPLPPHLQRDSLATGMVVTGRDELVSILHVPRLAEAARAARGEAVVGARATAGRGRAFKVLVVDDSVSTREIEKDVLEAHGYVVTLAEDGLDGWQKAGAGEFDAVLTDVEMPGLDGFSLTARLRQTERYRDTPIVIITSRESEADKRRGIEVGADAYIVKGDFNQTSLVDVLRNLLG